MQHIEANGYDLAYEVSGRGEPVLLIHGALIGDTFSPLVGRPELERFQLIRYHRRNIGASEHAADLAATIADHAADAAGLLEALGIDRAHVVGHSFGGPIAYALARGEPERVVSLSLLEAGFTNDIPSFDQLAAGLGGLVLPYYEGRHEEAVDGFLDAIGGRDAMGRIARSLGDQAVEQCRADVRTLFESELIASSNVRLPDDEADLPTQPMLLVRGGDSDAGPIAASGVALFTENHNVLRARHPGAHEAVLPGLTHLLQIDDPAPVAIALAAFLATVPNRADR